MSRKLFAAFAALDDEETRLLRELAEVRATLVRLGLAVEPPHGPAGVSPPVPESGPIPRLKFTPAPPAPSAETVPGKPEPRPASAESGADRRAVIVADLLHAMRAAGPLPIGYLTTVVGASDPTVRAALKSRPDWFQRSDPANRMSPWELTEGGRAVYTSPRPTTG